MYTIKDKRPEDYTALEIAVDFLTGERAGGIDPRKKGLICLSLWQDVDAGIEMRLVIDDRDTTQYEDVDGITVHRGAKAINKRVSQLFKTRFSIVNADLFRESIKNIDLGDIDPNLDPNEQLRICKDKKALGIKAQNPSTVECLDEL